MDGSALQVAIFDIFISYFVFGDSFLGTFGLSYVKYSPNNDMVTETVTDIQIIHIHPDHQEITIGHPSKSIGFRTMYIPPQNQNMK